MQNLIKIKTDKLTQDPNPSRPLLYYTSHIISQLEHKMESILQYYKNMKLPKGPQQQISGLGLVNNFNLFNLKDLKSKLLGGGSGGSQQPSQQQQQQKQKQEDQEEQQNEPLRAISSMNEEENFNYACDLMNQQRYDEAIPYLLHDLSIKEKEFGKDSYEAGQTLMQLLGAYQDPKYKEKLRNTFERVYPIVCEGERFNKSDSQTLIYTLFGKVNEVLEDYEQAIVFHKASLELCKCEGMCKDFDDESVPFVNNLQIGVNLMKLKQYTEALDYFNDAHAIQDTPQLRLLVAECLIQNGKEEAALGTLQIGQKQALAKFGVNSSQNCVFLVRMGKIYQFLENYQKAIETYETAKAIYVKLEETNNDILTGILDTIRYLGICYMNISEIDKAIIHFNLQKGMAEILFGKNGHFQVGFANNQLGVGYAQKGDFKMAQKHFEESLRIYINLNEEEKNYDEIALTLSNLGNIMMDTNQYQKALQLYKDALDIYTQMFGIDDPKSQESLQQIDQIEQKIQQGYK